MVRIVEGPRVSGLVTSRETGAPLGGVTVTVNQTVYTDAEMTAPATTVVTAGDGSFSFYALPGSYTFTTSAANASPLEPVEVLGHEEGVGKHRLDETVETFAASGAAITLGDLTAGSIKDVTLTANCTITLPTPVAGRSILVRLTQDATGGRTVTWSGTVKWPGAAVPTLTTTAGGVDLISLVSITGAAWHGLPAGYDLR